MNAFFTAIKNHIDNEVTEIEADFTSDAGRKVLLASVVKILTFSSLVTSSFAPTVSKALEAAITEINAFVAKLPPGVV
jgi:hypothetical protein